MILFNSLNDFNLRQKLLYKRWLKELAALEGYKIGDINYIFCDDEYLLGVNQQYLQHDTYTDIITFDYVEGKILNGDIYISTERVRENARIYQVDFENELKRVLSHGVLHLCGYKDKTDADAAQMREKENFAISLFSSQISCN
ncbi:MAG: rRNA maturation RNase YbeY [Bacteroidales bacterium]|nr:rRNA maturation RNase YbeY [Bacteroidales bacterium]